MTWQPDYAVAPGETLREWAEEHSQDATTLALACRRMKLETLEGILAGTTEITAVLAGALQAGTGIPARFWLNLERAYRAKVPA